MRKLSKKLLLSILSVALVFIALGTTTFAWFSMNTTVTAKEMQVRLVAEKGLLINEIATANDANWDDVATANQKGTTLSALYPTSTSDGSTWYHASSKKSYSSASATSGTASGDLVAAYETLSGLTALTSQSVTTAVGGSQAAYNTMGKAAGDAAGYYVVYTYYLKSSSEEITLGTTSGSQNVRIKSVTATEPEDKASAELNKSLRVGIKLKDAFYIYAPVTGYTSSYYVNASSTATTPIAGTTPTPTDLAKLPASTAAGAPVQIFIWYEGEDAHCMSDNVLATVLDNISITVEFELVPIA